MHSGTDFDVVIAGAGIVGAAIAHHLARDGLRVCVVDRSGPAAQASGASDGAVSVASKRPGVLAQLAGDALDYCGALARSGGPLHGIFHYRPAYFFASHALEEAALDALVDKLRALDGPARVVADHRNRAAIPLPLGPDVRRLIEIGGEGHMLGYAATQSFLAHPRIACKWPLAVDGIEPDGDCVRIRTSKGDLRASWAVVALGVASASLIPLLPLRPRTGQLLVTDRETAGHAPLPGALTAAAYLVSKTAGLQSPGLLPVVIDPLVTGQYLIGSSREEHGDAARIDTVLLQQLLQRAVAAFPALSGRRVIRAFAGVRCAVADSLPVVGWVPGLPRVAVATGFEGDGICLSALVGREVAAMVAGRAVHADIGALSPARFEHAELVPA